MSIINRTEIGVAWWPSYNHFRCARIVPVHKIYRQPDTRAAAKMTRRLSKRMIWTPRWTSHWMWAHSWTWKLRTRWRRTTWKACWISHRIGLRHLTSFYFSIRRMTSSLNTKRLKASSKLSSISKMKTIAAKSKLRQISKRCLKVLAGTNLMSLRLTNSLTRLSSMLRK